MTGRGSSDAQWANADVTSYQTRLAVRDDIMAAAQILIAEFDGVLPAGVVIRQVARARDELLDTGVQAGVGAAAEAMARARLRGLTSRSAQCR